MTGEAHRAVVTDPAVNTQVFLWQEGCIFVCIYGFGWTPGVGDGQGGLVCCGSWGHKESDTSE